MQPGRCVRGLQMGTAPTGYATWLATYSSGRQISMLQTTTRPLLQTIQLAPIVASSVSTGVVPTRIRPTPSVPRIALPAVRRLNSTSLGSVVPGLTSARIVHSLAAIEPERCERVPGKGRWVQALALKRIWLAGCAESPLTRQILTV